MTFSFQIAAFVFFLLANQKQTQQIDSRIEKDNTTNKREEQPREDQKKKHQIRYLKFSNEYNNNKKCYICRSITQMTAEKKHTQQHKQMLNLKCSHMVFCRYKAKTPTNRTTNDESTHIFSITPNLSRKRCSIRKMFPATIKRSTQRVHRKCINRVDAIGNTRFN